MAENNNPVIQHNSNSNHPNLVLQSINDGKDGLIDGFEGEGTVDDDDGWPNYWIDNDGSDGNYLANDGDNNGDGDNDGDNDGDRDGDDDGDRDLDGYREVGNGVNGNYVVSLNQLPRSRWKGSVVCLKQDPSAVGRVVIVSYGGGGVMMMDDNGDDVTVMMMMMVLMMTMMVVGMISTSVIINGVMMIFIIVMMIL